MLLLWSTLPLLLLSFNCPHLKFLCDILAHAYFVLCYCIRFKKFGIHLVRDLEVLGSVGTGMPGVIESIRISA